MKLKLPVKQISLADALPGSLVIYDGIPSFVVISPMDPQKRPALATLDREPARFRHLFFNAMPQVLAYVGEVVATPDLSQFPENSRPNQDSGTLMFLSEGSAFVVVCLADGREWRLLDLVSGSLAVWNGQEMPTYRHWTVCIEQSGNKEVPLITF